MERNYREFLFEGSPDGRHRGPNLAVVAIVYTVFSLLSLLFAFVFTRGSAPEPFGPGYFPRFYFGGYLPALRLSAFFEFVAAIPLGIFTATAVSRLRFLGLNVAGVYISLAGGFGAAIFMAIGGLFRWTLSEPALSTMPYVPLTVRLLSFAVGSIGFVVLFGQLMAGISIISWFSGLLPRWLAGFGLILFALAEITSLALLLNPLAILVPVVEVLGFVWMIATGFLLPQIRREAGQTTLAAAA